MEAILDRRRAELLARTRQVLGRLRDVLSESAADESSRSILVSAVEQLDGLFLLVVAGEFNSGKSAFINALLGREVLDEGVTPTTSQIWLLRHGPESSSRQLEEGVWELTAPVDLLREIVLVDTPGTNAILREHEALTARFVPRSDLVLFITSADRPFTESERSFLAAIRDWGKKIVLVVNKIDLLANDADRAEVVEFVADAARRLIGDVQALFPVSAKMAKAAKAGQPEHWASSGFEALESFVREALDDESRFRLKLQSPLGVGLRLADEQLATVALDLASLAEDRDRVDDIEAQGREYEADMRRGFQARLAEIDNILMSMEKRGDDFFDETIRFGRMPDLLRTKATQAAFEQVVVADVPTRIDDAVTELIDWLVTQDLRQWAAVTEHLEPAAIGRAERIVGGSAPAAGSLAHDRQVLVESLRDSSRNAIGTFDERAEAARIAEAARSAVLDTGIAGVGVGIGVAVAAAAHVVWLDATGILTGLLAAVLGLVILPSRRAKAKGELRSRLGQLRRDLMDGLDSAFEREMRRSSERIESTVAPFARFVRAETEKAAARRERLGAIQSDMRMLLGELAR